MTEQAATETNRLAALFEVEHRVRGAESRDAFCFIAVNEARTVVDYQQAALLEPAVGGWRVTAISDVPQVDRAGLFVQWLEKVAKTCDLESTSAQTVAPDGLGQWPREIWPEVSPPTVRLIPLVVPGQAPVAWLWLARDGAWADNEVFLLDHMAEVMGHALAALTRRRGRGFLRRRWRRNAVVVTLLVILAVVLALPVQLSALAPAEVVPRNPAIVAAPMNGVVEHVLVKPNEQVTKDQPLVRFQDRDIRNQVNNAQAALSVAKARYQKALQESFRSRESRAQLAVLKAQVELADTKLAFARRQLDKVVLRASRDGVAIFNNPDAWAGRPVNTGERIMQLAQPKSRMVRVELPVDDAMVIQPGSTVTLFLNTQPLDPVAGHVLRTSYKPTVNARNQVVYRVRVRLTEMPDFLHVGLRGTAKINGETVSLAYYLFRRPLTALRQTIGM